MGDPHVIKKRGKQEEEDFKILFRDYFASMCVFANRYLEDGEMARDVVHDVFCRLWENPSELVGVANVKNYLYTSVKTCCVGRISIIVTWSGNRKMKKNVKSFSR